LGSDNLPCLQTRALIARHCLCFFALTSRCDCKAKDSRFRFVTHCENQCKNAQNALKDEGRIGDSLGFSHLNLTYQYIGMMTAAPIPFKLLAIRRVPTEHDHLTARMREVTNPSDREGLQSQLVAKATAFVGFVKEWRALLDLIEPFLDRKIRNLDEAIVGRDTQRPEAALQEFLEENQDTKLEVLNCKKFGPITLPKIRSCM
jgi:hypothetical protein